MRVKDRFLEKISFLIFICMSCFSHHLQAENIYEKIFNYNEGLKNSSASFIQTDLNQPQEGIIFFGDDRIKISYTKPQKLTIILSKKKGMYVNHNLKESEFFVTKNSYIKFFFDFFQNKNQIKNMVVKQSSGQIEIREKIALENTFFNIKVIYENEPIKLRRLEIVGNDEKIQMGFFEHNKEDIFDKNFFTMIDPYSN